MTNRRARRAKKPADELTVNDAPASPNDRPDDELTDAHKVTILSVQLAEARNRLFVMLQRLAAKRIEYGEIHWDGATAFINREAQAFEQALEAIEQNIRVKAGA